MANALTLWWDVSEELRSSAKWWNAKSSAKKSSAPANAKLIPTYLYGPRWGAFGDVGGISDPAPLRAFRKISILVAGNHLVTAQGMSVMPDTPDRILRLNAVLDRTGLSRSTLYRKMQTGTFPNQVKIAVRCAGWRESAVNAWLRNPMFYSADEQEGS